MKRSNFAVIFAIVFEIATFARADDTESQNSSQKDVTLYINAFSASDELRYQADSMLDHVVAVSLTQTVIVKFYPDSWLDLNRSLEALPKDMVVSRIFFGGHGSPGRIYINGTPQPDSWKLAPLNYATQPKIFLSSCSVFEPVDKTSDNAGDTPITLASVFGTKHAQIFGFRVPMGAVNAFSYVSWQPSEILRNLKRTLYDLTFARISSEVAAYSQFLNCGSERPYSECAFLVENTYSVGSLKFVLATSLLHLIGKPLCYLILNKDAYSRVSFLGTFYSTFLMHAFEKIINEPDRNIIKILIQPGTAGTGIVAEIRNSVVVSTQLEVAENYLRNRFFAPTTEH